MRDLELCHGARRFDRSGVKTRDSDPPSHTHRGPGWRQLHKLPQKIVCWDYLLRLSVFDLAHFQRWSRVGACARWWIHRMPVILWICYVRVGFGKAFQRGREYKRGERTREGKNTLFCQLVNLDLSIDKPWFVNWHIVVYQIVNWQDKPWFVNWHNLL